MCARKCVRTSCTPRGGVMTCARTLTARGFTEVCTDVVHAEGVTTCARTLTRRVSTDVCADVDCARRFGRSGGLRSAVRITDGAGERDIPRSASR